MTTTLQGPNFLPFDIETVANAQAKAYYAAKVYEAPSNYKDPEKIEDYKLKARFEDEKKAALSWWTGKIVCIHVRSLYKRTGKSFVGENEAALLNAFFNWVTAEGRGVLIGKSSKYFDSPFMIGRCIALDLGIPSFLRPYRQIEDIDEVFGIGARADQAGKLSDYAAGMGIASKLGNGQDVQHWYNAATTGKDPEGFKKIATYCEGDVMIVDEFLRRWSKAWTPAGAAAAPEVTPPTPEIVDGVEIPFPPSSAAVPVPAPTKAKPKKTKKPDEPKPAAPAPATETDPMPPMPAILQAASPLNELEFE